ncbi:MAG: hypothetical protein JWM91_2486 [Rhodospirillales bacterium]|nr:hypothetical protein [Rhodospirillales bacterium]
MALNLRPSVSVTPLKSGRGFSAKIIWPTGESEVVGYFRHRSEALSWIVNDADAWLASHRAETAKPVYARSAIDTPRAGQFKRALSSGTIVYDTLSPGDASLHRNVPVPSVERTDLDRRQIDIVQAPYIDVDLIRI